MIRSHSAKWRVSSLVLSALLSACSTLPSSGPTRGEILHDKEGARILGFQIVDIDSPAAVAQADEMPTQPPALAQLAAEGAVDAVGPGDILGVTIYEVGQGLFSGNFANLGGESGGGNAQAENAGLSGIVVDRDGAITIPYAGRIVVAGLTPVQIQKRIQGSLKGLSANPQAIVSIRRNVTNAIFVLGVVARPGRQELSLAHDHVLDAIAQAGGTGLQAQEDMVVRFTRQGRSIEQLLSTIKAGSADDLSLLPGDRIQVLRRPQSYTVFGATRVSQVNFDNPTLTLAEALARATGPNDLAADPSAIFIFRYTRGPDGTPIFPSGQSGSGAGISPPTIFRINLMHPASYFLAQNFLMRDKDVLYVANAQSNRPAKLVAILNQLISPAVTAKVLTQ